MEAREEVALPTNQEPQSAATSLARENAELRRRLAQMEQRAEEAESTVRAIQEGQVDAIVVESSEDSKVFTLAKADRFYLQLAQEVANVGSWDWDLVGGRLEWSDGLQSLLMSETDSCSSDDWWQLVHPDDRERLRKKVESLLESRDNDFYDEFRVVRGDGSMRWVASKGRVIRGLSNHTAHLVGVNFDITERRQSEDELHRREQALLASEERFRLATEAVSGLIYDADLATGHVWRSPVLRELLGYVPEEIPDTLDWWNEQLHPDDLPQLQTEQQAVLERPSSQYVHEYRVRHADGYWVRVLDKGLALRDAEGRAIRRVGCIIDVTQLRAAEKALQRSERNFRELANSMPQMVWAARADGYIDYYNRRWFEFTGFPEGAGGDESWKPILHPDDVDRSLDTWYTAVRTGALYQIEYRFWDKQRDEYRWHLGRALPIRNEQGEIVRWFGTCTDIHDQKALQDRLRESDRRKDEFLAMLAHELRNPLSPLMAAAELLEMEAGNPKQVAQLAQVLSRQVEQLKRLIDDLLDVSRISRGKLELRCEPVSLKEAIEAALDIAEPQIKAASHTLKVSISDQQMVLDGDRVRLAQVVANLLVNAAKYTPPGGKIQLTARREGDRAIVSVRDNGIGIPPEMLDQVFGLFTQVDGSATRSQGGLGIGLTLVKTLVEMHRGTVRATSEGTGKGSEFVIELPVAPVDALRPEQPPACDLGPELPCCRVMVIDDNRSASHLLSRLLERLGQEVMVRDSAVTGLQAMAEFDPDIVISDIAMPEVSGYELARSIRSASLPRQPVLIALTGYGQETDRSAAREAGFDFHYTKPVGLPMLRSILEAAGEARGVSATDISQARSAVASPK